MNKSFIRNILMLITICLITCTFSCTNPSSESPVENYTITFKANNSSATGSTASITAAANTTVALTKNGFVLEGYNFTGWNTAANGSGTSYANGASIKLTQNLILYAQWSKQIQDVYYTITFNSNNQAATGTTASIREKAGTTVTLTANGYSLEGYNFIGWNTEYDGSGTGYADGSSVKLTGDLILYAQWILATVPVYSIVINSTDNIPVSVSQNKAEAGTEITVKIQPNELYVFESISVKTTDEREVSINPNQNDLSYYFFTMPEQDVTIKVVFKYIAHSITLAYGEHGIAVVDKSVAIPGTLVKVYIQDIEEYYVRGNCSVTDTNGNCINVSWFNGEYYRFTMPDDDVTINVTFDLVSYQVRFMYDKKHYGISYIKRGEKAKSVTIPEKITLTDNGVKFIYFFEKNTGWYSDPECTQLFDFDTAIFGQTNLYTKFKKIHFAEDGIKRHKIKDMYRSTMVEIEGNIDNSSISIINQDLQEIAENSSNIEITLDCSDSIITELEDAKNNENASFKNCKSLISIVLPQTVTYIGEEAFTGCSSLKQITIPNSVTSIGKKAFSGCTSLKEITIPDSVRLINEGVFSGCSELKEITIPFVGQSANEDAGETAVFGYIFGKEPYEGGVKIYSSTYSNNIEYYIPKKLYKVTILGGQIQQGAFYWCQYISKIILPEGLLSIKEKTFYQCGIKDIVIPETVTSIGEESFSGCKVSTLLIPKNVNAIESNSFIFASQLTEINVDNNNPYFSSENGVMYNKDKTKLLMFPRNKAQAFVIPNSVNTIGKYAFFGCKNIMSEIPETVTNIEEHAFSCSEITQIIIPESITILRTRSFNACKQLTEVSLPSSLEEIGGWVFDSCTAIKNITIPSKVSKIGSKAFYKCDNLENVIFEDSTSTWKVDYDYIIDVSDSAENARLFKMGCKELRKI